MKKNIIDFKKPKRMFAPEFNLCSKKIGDFYFYPPKGKSSKNWYLDFEKRIKYQIKKKQYFPVFRMSDGEFIFLLSRRFGHLKGINKLIAIFQHIKRSLFYRSQFYSSGRKGYCETYSPFDLTTLRKQFLKDVKKISRMGMICPNYSPDDLTNFYQKDILNLLNKNKIILTDRNYFGYYFISIFFLGKNLNTVFLNKKILFITSNMNVRNRNLKKNLIKFGAKKVDFYYTSLNRPMKDMIDLKKITTKPDIVFVAAGVGSSHILVQLKKLKCLCVDCGYMVDALSDIALAKKRVFHLNDIYYEKKNYTIKQEVIN